MAIGAKENPPPHVGHRQRLRERFFKNELAGMLDYEKLELLLTFAIPRRDVKPLARELLAYFGSLSGVFNATLKELRNFPGIGDQAATLLHLVPTLSSDYLEEKMRAREVLRNPQAVADFARSKIGGRKIETVMGIYLDAFNRAIAYNLTEGTVDHANVYLRNVVNDCNTHGASALIIVHNHPSGDCTPSDPDIRLTSDLHKALSLLGIRFLDHLVVGGGGWKSMRADGYFDAPNRRVADGGGAGYELNYDECR